MDDHVRIFDTTLRDGEQSPGCTMTRDEKLEVARQLTRLNVDIIEAGFPAASPGDWEAVNAIAKEFGTPDGPVICGLARAHRGVADTAHPRPQPARRPHPDPQGPSHQHPAQHRRSKPYDGNRGSRARY